MFIILCTHMYMYILACLCFYIIVCSMYRHVYEYIVLCIHGTYTYLNIYIYLYVACLYAFIQLHNHTSFPIRPDQPCDAGESQLRAGSSPSEQPPSCHQSSQLIDHPGAACHVQTATATRLPHTHCCHSPSAAAESQVPTWKPDLLCWLYL